MEALNTIILGIASGALLALLGLTIWALKIIMEVRGNCGPCQANVKNIDKRQGGLEKRQDVLEADHGDLALKVGKIDSRVQVLEDIRG
jgi:hypothetical protein